MSEKLVLKYILKNNLPFYVQKTFNHINPKSEFYSNWHIDLICDYLKEIENNSFNRLIINIPPRSLKSICVSVAWTSWLLGHRPESRILTSSYSQNISNKLSQDTRFIIESEWYKKLFPETRISKKQNQKSKFLTTKYGFRFSTSVGGSVTGEGGDYLIVDDPHNPSHIHSKKLRHKTIDWFLNTFSTRLNNRKTGKIIIVMQRLHNDDLCGFLENSSPNEWEILKIPLLSEKKLYFSAGDNKYKMEKDEIINNKLFDKETIEKLISEIGIYNFESQYLQKPRTDQYNFLNKDYINYYEKLPEKFDSIIHSWDTAIKTSENSDYSALTIWGIYQDRYYLINFLQEKLEYPDLKKEIKNYINKFSANTILIEDKSSGHSIIQDLKRDGIKNIISIKPLKDKLTRFASVIELFERGQVLIPKNNNKFITLVNNLLEFPNVKNDDIVDSVSQFLNYSKEINIKKHPKIYSL